MSQVIGATTPRTAAEDRNFDPLCVLPVPGKIRKTNPPREKWNPAQLPRRMQKLIYAMCFGVNKTMFPDSAKPLPPGTPLSIRQAAFALGMRPRSCDRWSLTPIFREALKSEVLARRHFEEPENVAVALSIRDDPTAYPRDRLLAVNALRVREPSPAVNVSIAQQTLLGGARIAAGYVIKIDTGPADRTPERAVGRDYREHPLAQVTDRRKSK